MVQQKTPGDYVVGTGIEHSVEDFAKKAFEYVGLNYKDYVVMDNASGNLAVFSASNNVVFTLYGAEVT